MLDAGAGVRRQTLASFPPATKHPCPGWERATILVTVKAYPAIAKVSGESVCVAGVRLDTPSPEWIRLFPVGFRALPSDRKFRKYQAVRLNVRRTEGTDRRPESRRPDLDSLEVGSTLGTSNGWRDRWNILGDLVDATTACALNRASRELGQDSASLGLIKPTDISDVVVEDNPKYTPGAAVPIQDDLFGGDAEALEAAPFIVHYHYRCAAPGCTGHKQSLIDWESGQFARGRLAEGHTRGEARRLQRTKFLDELCSANRDTHFYIGNQHQHPGNYLVLGVFWPPAGSNPRGLF